MRFMKTFICRLTYSFRDIEAFKPYIGSKNENKFATAPLGRISSPADRANSLQNSTAKNNKQTSAERIQQDPT